MSEPAFGRLPSPDSRDLSYRAAFLLDAIPPPTVTTRYYRTGAVLDQGLHGICVGAAWRQWLSSALLMTRDGPDMLAIYRAAILLDEWDDNDNDVDALEYGTSVRAGAKALQERGHLSEYHWASTADDVRDWLLHGFGTVVVGSYWMADMLTPDARGFIHPTGSTVGGHAYLLCGYSGTRHAVRVINSWSASWGENGRAWLALDDLAELLRLEGEACMAVERKVV